MIWYTYSIFNLCTALSVARMHKEFFRGCQHGTQSLHYNVRSALNIIICKSTIYNVLTHWHIVNYLRRLAPSDITYVIGDYDFLNGIINAEWIITQPPWITVTRKNTIFARWSNFRHFMDPKNSLTCSKALISGSYLQSEETSSHHPIQSNREI
jgi:hypothetical protein